VALTRNGTHGIRPERSGRNLIGISGSGRDFKRGKTCSVLTGMILSEAETTQN